MQELFELHNEHPVDDIGQIFLTHCPFCNEYPGEQIVHVEELVQLVQFEGHGIEQAT